MSYHMIYHIIALGLIVSLEGLLFHSAENQCNILAYVHGISNLFQRRSGHYGKTCRNTYVPFMHFLIQVGFDIPPPRVLLSAHEWRET